jgi:hypothetical protein
MLARISDHGNGLSIVSGHYSKQRRMPLWMKSDSFADLVVQHLRVRAHLAQKTQTLHNSVVKIDKFRFTEFVDINCHHRSNPSSVGLTYPPTCDSQPYARGLCFPSYGPAYLIRFFHDSWRKISAILREVALGGQGEIEMRIGKPTLQANLKVQSVDDKTLANR